jgi:hypothetical protein
MQAPVAFLLALLAAVEEGGAAAPLPAEAAFHQHIAPIIRRNCAGCHGGESPKGELSMESLARFLEGGKKGPPVVPGKPGESLVFLMLTGEKKPVMPPRSAEPLSESEILTFRAWIEGGAKAGEAAAEPEPYSAAPEPPVYPRPPVITALLFTPGGQLLVAGYREVLVHDPALPPASETVADAGLVAVPSAPAAEPVARLVGEAERIHALALAPGGKLLLAAGGSPGRFGELQLWDLDASRMVRFRRSGKDTLFAAAFAAGGSRLIVAGADRAIRCFDAESLEEVYAAELHADWVFGLDLPADGSRLFSGGRDKTVKISTADGGKFVSTLASLTEPVTRVVAQPASRAEDGSPREGELVLVTPESGQPLLYRAAEAKEVRKLEKQPGAVLAAAFSADGARLALGGAGGEIRLYGAADGKRLAALPAGGHWIYALAFHPDGHLLAAGGYEGMVRLYDLEAKKESRAFLPVRIDSR